MLNIALTDFRRLFHSPLAWGLLALLGGVLAYVFFILLQRYIGEIQPQIIANEAPYGVTDLVIMPLLSWAGVLMLVVMPLLTMRSFAEEQQNGTLVLLRSAPISTSALVLGKYLSLVLLISVFIGLITLMPLSLSMGTALDWGQVLSALLGLFLLLTSFAAAGLFASSLTKQPILAALIGFGILLVLGLFYVAGQQVKGSDNVLQYLSHFGHYLSFLGGWLDSRDIVYFLLFAALFIGLTIRRFSERFWLVALPLLLVVGLLAWFSVRYFTAIDISHGQRNTLSKPTQGLLTTIKEPLTFVAYVSADKPQLHKALEKMADRYRQFKADTTLEILDPNLNPERAKADQVLSEGRVVLQLGKRSEVLPSVDEKTVANTLQRMVRGSIPKVIVLEGHQERSVFEKNGSGMSKLHDLLRDRGYRFQPHKILLTQSIPQDTGLLVIASPQQDYLASEVKIINDYIARGGNLLWLLEPNMLAGLEPLQEKLALTIGNGTLLDSNAQLQEMLGIKHPAVIPVVRYEHALLKNLTTPVLLPFATLVEKQHDSETNWSIETLLSSPDTSWLETGKMSGKVERNYADGDLPGPLGMAVSMSRARPNSPQQQRIAVVGDSDFLLNEFIGLGQGGNLSFSLKLFDWLSNSDQLLNIAPQAAPDSKLELSDRYLFWLAIGFMFLLPLTLLLIGGFRWWWRRRR